jgi:hypothetical protein
MAAGVVFTTGVTSFKCQIRVLELLAEDNVRGNDSIRVFSQDGSTERAALLGQGGHGPATEPNTSFRNKTFLDGDLAVATYTTVEGDRLVVEIGYNDQTGVTPIAQAEYGGTSGGSDLPEDETTTTQDVPWFEISTDITWSTGQIPTVSINPQRW